MVEKLAYKDGNVFINKEQYFGNVPEVAWNFSGVCRRTWNDSKNWLKKSRLG